MSLKCDVAQQIASSCLIGQTRHLSRLLTTLYDGYVRIFGLRASQIALLAAISVHGPVRRSDLGRRLDFEPSTLTRNLRIMLANGWIDELSDNSDARGLPLQITAAGADLLAAIGPAWHNAQARAFELIGVEGLSVVRSAINTGPKNAFNRVGPLTDNVTDESCSGKRASSSYSAVFQGRPIPI